MSQNQNESPNGYWAGTRRTDDRDPLQPFGQAPASAPVGRAAGGGGARSPWWLLVPVALLLASVLAAWLLLSQRGTDPQADPAPASSPSAATSTPGDSGTPGATRTAGATSPSPAGDRTSSGSPRPTASDAAPGSQPSGSAPATPATSPSPVAPAPSETNRTSIPFTSTEDNSAGTFEILESSWTSRGLLLRVRVSLAQGQQRLGFFALDNETARQYDSSYTDQTYLGGRPIVAGQTLEGTVLFEKEPGDTTVFLTGSRGRQVAALLVKG